MTPAAPTPPVQEAAQAQASRVAFERLRQRTDELELLVSGLFAFTLLALPGPIFDAYARASVHVEGLFEHILRFGLQVAVGMGYALAFAFIAHLAIRAYWVGLVGLKSTFPAGIRWERVPLIGPVTRPFYQREVGDVGQAIDRADRAASIVFAMTTLIAVVLLYTGALTVAGLLLSGLIARPFADHDRATLIIFLGGYAVLAVFAFTPMLLDRIVARREARGRPSPGLRALGERLLRLVGWVVPQRLIYAVQYTLQSNLPGRRFMAVYFGGLLLASTASAWMLVGSSRLTLVDSYTVLTGDAVEHGLLGAHYESMRGHDDQLAVVPMVPSDRVADSHLRLFIPYLPRRDNPLARQRCGALVAGHNAASDEAAARLGQTCLAGLWSVSLDGTPVPLDEFIPAERRDLGMRGLMGYIEVAGLRPGLHRLALVWNAGGGDSGPLRRREHVIPFWFTPAVPAPPVGAP